MIIKNTNPEELDDLVSDILDEYEKRLSGWKVNVKIDSKKLEQACIEQASWLAYYDEIKVNLKSLLDFYDMRIRKIRSECFISITKNSNLVHTDRAKDIMVDSDPVYVKFQKKYLEIKELYSMANSVVEQLRDRAFMLNNIIKIRVAALEDITLTEDA